MAETWILYKTTNLVNSKIYVGVHKLADTTRSKKYLGSGDQIRAAIKKYGRENFTRETLAQFSCFEDVYSAEANLVNQEFINRDDTYNICLGGRGGGTSTPEIREKISNSAKGRKFSKETRAKIAESNKGRTTSDETRAKISAAHKGNTHYLGHKHSEETKAKIGAASKGNKVNLGRVLSEEHKEKISAASPNSKPTIIYGKYYTSLSEAAKFEKISVDAVQYRIKSCKPEWDEWRLATEEEIASFSLMVNLEQQNLNYIC